MIAAGFPLARHRLLIFMRQHLALARRVRLHGPGTGGLMDPPFWHCMHLAAANRLQLLQLIDTERSTSSLAPPPPALPANWTCSHEHRHRAAARCAGHELKEDNMATEPLVFIKMPEVKRRTGLGKTTIYDRISAGTFPAPVPLGGNAVGWIEAEVDAWQAARVAERDGIEPPRLHRVGVFLLGVSVSDTSINHLRRQQLTFTLR